MIGLKTSAPATFAYTWSVPGLPTMDFFTLTHPIPGHCAKSTVSRLTLEKAGFSVSSAMPTTSVRKAPSGVSTGEGARWRNMATRPTPADAGWWQLIRAIFLVSKGRYKPTLPRRASTFAALLSISNSLRRFT